MSEPQVDQIEQAVTEFRVLNRRRLFGAPPLEVTDLERWSELRELLNKHFGSTLAGEDADSEKREHLRLPTHLRVVFESGEDLREAFLENISEGGIFVATERPLAVDTPLRLVIAAGSAMGPIEVAGRVTWIRPAQGANSMGMGVRFEELSGEQRTAIDDLLSHVLRNR